MKPLKMKHTSYFFALFSLGWTITTFHRAFTSLRHGGSFDTFCGAVFSVLCLSFCSLLAVNLFVIVHQLRKAVVAKQQGKTK